MAIVAVSAPYVVQAVADCAEKRVRAVQILTAGFAETGSAEGARWEEELYTAVGFPRVFYLRYHLYGTYFPLMALSEFKQHASKTQSDWPRSA
mgnify:CR=1 FL=1